MCQGWTYTQNNNDKWHLRLFVAFMVLMDFSITCLTSLDLRYYLMKNFGNPNVLKSLTKTMIVAMCIGLVVIYLTTLFFALRMYLFNKSTLWAATLAALFATGHLVLMSLQARANWKDPTIVDLTSPHTKLCGGISFAFLMVSLGIIAILPPRLSSVHTSVKMPQRILQQLHLLVVRRSLLALLNSTALLIVYASTTTNSLTMNWLPFLLFEPKIHVITMVAMLNTWTQQTDQLDEGVIPMANIKSSDRTFTPFMGKPADGSHDINPQTIHSIDGQQKHFIQCQCLQTDRHGCVLKTPQRVLEISVEKSVQVTEC